MKSLKQHVERLIGTKVKNLANIQKAFYHRSYTNEKNKHQSNERLEFLGDAVLEIIISDLLYNHYSNWSEGRLTQVRAQLVQESSLAYLSRQLRLNDYLMLGKGEINSGGRDRDSILADLFEAFLGALYLDFGMDFTYRFVKRILFTHREKIITLVSKDYKTLFQELVQKDGTTAIEYQLLKQEGPPHASVFTTGLYLNHELLATGQGRSKKQAETEAAKKAYEQMTAKGKS